MSIRIGTSDETERHADCTNDQLKTVAEVEMRIGQLQENEICNLCRWSTVGELGTSKTYIMRAGEYYKPVLDDAEQPIKMILNFCALDPRHNKMDVKMLDSQLKCLDSELTETALCEGISSGPAIIRTTNVPDWMRADIERDLQLEDDHLMLLNSSANNDKALHEAVLKAVQEALRS